jgi:signal transduction histidine kinase
VRDVATALNSTAGRLGDMIARAQRVAVDASHHLRTPLTGVRLRLEAIEDTADDPRIRSEAAAATSEVDRLTRRIDQVLALAKSDAATIGSVASDASLLVADRVAAVDPLASERGIAVESSIDPDLIAYTLPGLVGRSVDELLGNALDYARSRVRVSLKPSGDRVVLRVEDDGLGVPDEEHKRIFERFVRGAAANPGGSGLGLALVSEGAAASGGSVRAERSDLGGLAVVVAWPSGGR